MPPSSAGDLPAMPVHFPPLAGGLEAMPVLPAGRSQLDSWSHSNTPPPKKPKKTYFFIQDMEVNFKQQIIHTPAMYWASDKVGRKRLSPEQLAKYLDQFHLSPEDLHLHMHFVIRYFSPTLYDALRKIHTACGFDPDTNEIAKALGLPILEIEPKYRRLSEGTKLGQKYLF